MFTQVHTKPTDEVQPFKFLGPDRPDSHVELLGALLVAFDEERAEHRRNFDAIAADRVGRDIVRTRRKLYNVLWRERHSGQRSHRKWRISNL